MAVVVVTTALCAEQVAAVAPSAVTLGRVATRPQGQGYSGAVGDLAGRLVSRLSQTFRQAVPAAVPVQARQPTPAALLAPATPHDQSLAVARRPISPFQFRLPPPVA